jgi:hypothetical protein
VCVPTAAFEGVDVLGWNLAYMFTCAVSVERNPKLVLICLQLKITHIGDH